MDEINAATSQVDCDALAIERPDFLTSIKTSLKAMMTIDYSSN
jgi:hypothetical protein